MSPRCAVNRILVEIRRAVLAGCVDDMAVCNDLSDFSENFYNIFLSYFLHIPLFIGIG